MRSVILYVDIDRRIPKQENPSLLREKKRKARGRRERTAKSFGENVAVSGLLQHERRLTILEFMKLTRNSRGTPGASLFLFAVYIGMCYLCRKFLNKTAMAKNLYPVGIQSFRKIREADMYMSTRPDIYMNL